MKTKFSVTQFGKKLSKSKYTWDKDTKTFSSSEDNLVLDFRGLVNCTFYTGDSCTFNTTLNCIFNTGSNCTFTTGPYCIFNTGSNCTFSTGWSCIFNTGKDCIVIRREILEVIILEKEKNNIKLNECEVKGYEEVKKE
jgi:hypothetical protein